MTFAVREFLLWMVGALATGALGATVLIFLGLRVGFRAAHGEFTPFRTSSGADVDEEITE